MCVKAYHQKMLFLNHEIGLKRHVGERLGREVSMNEESHSDPSVYVVD